MLSEIGKDPQLLSPDISKSKDLFFIESHKKFTRIKMVASFLPGTFWGCCTQRPTEKQPGHKGEAGVRH